MRLPPAPQGSAPDLSPAWAHLLQLHPDGVAVIARPGGVRFLNAAARELLGVGEDTSDGDVLRALDPRTPDGHRLRARDLPVLRAFRTGRVITDCVVDIRRADGERRVVSVNAAPFEATEGGGVVVASVRDITAQRRAEARRHLAWEMVRALAASLHLHATVETVAWMAVPALGEVAVVDLLEGGNLRHAACRHLDHRRQAELEQWCAMPVGGRPAERVVASGEPLLVPRLEGTAVSVLGEDGRAAAGRLGFTAVLSVPLRARGETLGALTFFRVGGSFGGEERDFAEEVAAHAALALDNAHLYRAAHEARVEADERRRQVSSVLESITDAFFAVDADWRFTYLNRQAETLLGRPRVDLVGRALWDEFLVGHDGPLVRGIRDAMADRQARALEAHLPGTGPWVHAQIYPADEGLSVYLRDISKRKEAEAKERLLTDTGVALASSLDWEETLRRAAGSAVPVFADVCLIDVADGATVVRAAVAAADEERRTTVAEFGEGRPGGRRDGLAMGRALDHGEATFLPRVGAAELHRLAPDEKHRLALQQLGLESLIVLPLQARGERVGAIAFLYAGSGRRYSGRDLRVAEELGRRVALAIDNARLFRDARASDRAKSNFISVMSHEFRTPLTAIVGYAELLSLAGREALTPLQLRHVERIQSGAWHMTHLVDEVLTFSRIEAGGESLELRECDGAEVLGAALDMVRPEAAAKGLELSACVPDEPVRLRTDPHKLRQVLVNVLGNAVKFTAAGSVTARLARQDGRVQMAVEDTGIGIAPEDIERIFDSFWQVDQGTTRSAGGVGLGLTIARRLAGLLGGSLVVASEPGRGTVFTLDLPIDGPQPADRTPDATQAMTR